MKGFKREYLICIFTILLLIFSGCARAPEVPIENKVWQLTTVQDSENGKVIACSKEFKEIYEDALLIEYNCRAEDDKLCIADEENDEKWQGSYSLMQAGKGSTYKVIVDDKEGHAVTGVTDKYNSDSENTLIISIDNYTLNFTSAG